MSRSLANVMNSKPSNRKEAKAMKKSQEIAAAVETAAPVEATSQEPASTESAPQEPVSPPSDGESAAPEATVLEAVPAQDQPAAADPEPQAAPEAKVEEAQEATAAPAKVEMQLFERSVKIAKETRIFTSGGECRFFNPLDGKVHGNDLSKRWITLQPGSIVHFVSYVETPDCAVVLVEYDQITKDKDGKVTATEHKFSGTSLRKASFDKILQG